MIEPNYLETFLENVQNKSYSDVIEIEARSAEFNKSTSAIKSYRVEDNVAVIDVKGPLLKRVPWILSFLFGIQSMESIGRAFDTALSDKDVDGIFLHVDSPGSEVDGVQTLSDIIYNGRGKKPILSYIDGSGTSGAFWIASAAEQIILADKTTRTGSIGVVGVHKEVSEMAEKMGIGLHVFSAGKFKKIGNQFEKLSKDDIKYINSQFKYLHDLFIEGVEKNLAKTLPQDAKESKVYIGKQAIEAGLANAIMNRDAAMARLQSMIRSKSYTTSKYKRSAQAKGNNMKFKDCSMIDIVREIQATTNLDSLQTLEQDLISEASRRKASAKNWYETQQAESLKESTIKLVAQQRRMILANADFQKRQDEYNLGRQIGQRK